jgi:signal transduction histidine kinase
MTRSHDPGESGYARPTVNSNILQDASPLAFATTALADLRERRVSPEALATLASSLVALVSNADARVRQAVAEACEFLPDPHASQAIDLLLKDKTHWVLKRAELSAQRRAVEKKKRSRNEERAETLQELLQLLETDYDADARAIAERGVRIAEETMARTLRHETDSVIAGFEQQLIAVEREALKERPDLKRLRKHASGARESLRRTMEVISKTLSFASELKVKIATASVAAIVEDAFAETRQTFGERASELELVPEIEDGLEADVDSDAITQVVHNLVKNAAQAYPEGVKRFVRVRARTRDTAHVEIAVEDRGQGMSGDQVAEMFTAYQSTREEGQGVGNLIIAKMVREGHGGNIDVKSALGEGTTITLTLPSKQRGTSRARRKK